MPLPPGPTTPAVVQTLRWIRDSYAELDAAHARHGDTFTFRFAGMSPAVFSADPTRIHEVFTADPDVMRAGKGNDILLPFLGEHSVLTLDGPRHDRDRRLLLPPFHGQRMRAYGRIIQESAQRATAGWAAGREVATQPAMQSASLDVILRAVFGVDDDARLAHGRAVLAGVLAAVSPALVFLRPLRVDLGRFSPWGHYLRQRAAAEALTDQEVARRRAQPGEDILSLLLQAKDERGQPLSEEELHGELTTLLVAGHETTANALAWAFAWLGAEPEVCARLTAEIDAAGDDPDTLARLPYLGAVCNEVLRILPVFPLVMRVLGRPWRWGAWDLDEGVRVAPCIYLAHRRPEVFPEPDRFRPDRFLERSYGPAEYFPFGGGARRCVGAAFALYEMKLVLATVLARFRIGGVTAGPPRPERRNIAIGPAHGARIRILEVRADDGRGARAVPDGSGGA